MNMQDLTKEEEVNSKLCELKILTEEANSKLRGLEIDEAVLYCWT